jgi:hypothetical protein
MPTAQDVPGNMAIDASTDPTIKAMRICVSSLGRSAAGRLGPIIIRTVIISRMRYHRTGHVAAGGNRAQL